MSLKKVDNMYYFAFDLKSWTTFQTNDFISNISNNGFISKQTQSQHLANKLSTQDI